MPYPPLYILPALALVFAVVCLVLWALFVRCLTTEARFEYTARRATRPVTVDGIEEDVFVRLYVSCFQPRWMLYTAGALLAVIVISPAAFVATPLLYDMIWRVLGAPEWGGRTGYVFMFSLFFGIVFIWAFIAALFARFHHLRAPEPFNHALARARGQPIEDTGWRARPKWARNIDRAGKTTTRD